MKHLTDSHVRANPKLKTGKKINFQVALSPVKQTTMYWEDLMMGSVKNKQQCIDNTIYEIVKNRSNLMLA